MPSVHDCKTNVVVCSEAYGFRHVMRFGNIDCIGVVRADYASFRSGQKGVTALIRKERRHDGRRVIITGTDEQLQKIKRCFDYTVSAVLATIPAGSCIL
jgi:hypothetical protein